jgi:hypothetical protein
MNLTDWSTLERLTLSQGKTGVGKARRARGNAGNARVKRLGSILSRSMRP